jgi:hypothetical protein
MGGEMSDNLIPNTVPQWVNNFRPIYASQCKEEVNKIIDIIGNIISTVMDKEDKTVILPELLCERITKYIAIRDSFIAADEVEEVEDTDNDNVDKV